MVFVNSCPRSSTSRDGGYFYSNEGNEPMHIHAVKEIAASKSVGYQTQLRMWIAEGTQREAKRG
jgi:hypothetical protein